MTTIHSARSGRGALRRLVAAGAALLMLAGGMTALTPAERAEAANGANFDPGYIVSDANFFDANALSVAQIQAFLNAQVPNCRGNCLKNYRETTRTIPGTPMCSTYSAGANETAAAIIYKVQRACGISAKVILVTLQKEQGLVGSSAPSAYAYRSAMGAGCPDTAACDSNYYGFFNQVHYGAYLMKRYTQPPGTGAGTQYNTRFDRMYPVGETSNILFHPIAACGTSPVHVRNQATHVLYTYTPYQPNAAALANINGTGDGCSSYGNRNFFRFYSDWFGAPTEGPNPQGRFESVSGGVGSIRVDGWAFDPNTTSPIMVSVDVDGRRAANWSAGGFRPDVGRAYPTAGPNHGFSGGIVASPGAHRVCVLANNVGAGTHVQLGCKTVTVISPSPIGRFEGATGGGGSLTVRGWAIDPNTASPVTVNINVDGQRVARVVADETRTDVARAYPATGPDHGFTASVPAAPGRHEVCLLANNIGAGSHSQLGCRIVTVLSTSPMGRFDDVRVSGTSMTASGWAFDPESTASIDVQARIGSNVIGTAKADAVRADVQRNYPGQGSRHGYSASFRIPVGTSEVCMFALNTGSGSDTRIGCKSVATAGAAPIGRYEKLESAGATADFSGWTFDADSSTPISIRVQVNGGAANTILADGTREDVKRAHPAQGSQHGFSGSVSVRQGANTVCITAVGVGGGTAASSLGCKTVQGTAPGANPRGAIEDVTATYLDASVSGWAFDADTRNPIQVRISVNGVAQTVPADVARPDIQAANPSQGPRHGYSIPVSLEVGANEICVTAVGFGGGLPSADLGCREVIGQLPPNVLPTGRMDSLTVSDGSATVTGWAFDANTTEPIRVEFRVDGARSGEFGADLPRADVQRAYPSQGPNHGYGATFPIPAGTKQVCVFGIDDRGEGVVQLACRAVTR